MSQIEDIMSTLSPEERQAVLTIMKEQATRGSSTALTELFEEDYEEIPVDIDTFLESPRYLGNATNNGTAIYPYWRNAYRQIIDNDKVECAFSGSIGCGKACSLDSNLIGPGGYFKMKDVKVGDLVAGEDGKFHTVIGVFPQGYKPTYHVNFSDGTYVDCSDDHIWSILDKNNEIIDVTTLDIISMRTNNEKVEIPQLTAAVRFHIPQYNVEDCFAEGDNGMLTVKSSLLTAPISLRVDICMNTLKKLGNINLNNRSIQLTNRFVNNFQLFCDIYRSIGCVVNENGSDTVDIFVPEWLNPYDEGTDSYYLIQMWGDMRHKYVVSVDQIPDKECQCIYVDNPSHLFLTNNFTPTHNTTAAIYLMSYFVYKLMCLRNIRQYFGLEGNGPVCIAFLNNTLQLSKGVAYDKFMSTVASSPWFLERGEVRGTVNLRYKPEKNIEFVIGSSADQIIGRDIFCLTGDTRIETADGTQCLVDLENKSIRVKCLDNNGNVILSEKPVKIVRTKEVAAVRIITLQDKTTIRCTFNHRFLMVDMTYKEAKDIKRNDKLYSPTQPQGILVSGINFATYQNSIPVYDVINVEPYHNFVVNTGKNFIISHNCGLIDEINFCLDANTPIVTTKGVKSLVDVSPSDKLFSYNIDNHKLHRSLSDGGMPTAYVDEYVELELVDGTTLRCSKNHRFLLSSGEYKQAYDLTEDDDLMEMSPYGYVYISTNKINGKRYIGQHKGLFDSSYLGSGDALWLAIQKYGRRAFETEVIEYCYSANELDERENYWLLHYNAAKSDKFYNITNYQYPITSNCVIMHKNGHMKRVTATDMQQYLDNGYELGIDPSMNFHAGKCYIIRDSCVKLVPLSERDRYIDIGWDVFSPNRGKVVINNGAMLRYVDASELAECLREGWVIGNCFNTSFKSHRWMNNGEVDIHVDKSQTAKFEKLGFKFGRCYQRDRLYMTDGKINMLVYRSDVDNYKSKGFRIGKYNSNSKGARWVKKGNELKRIAATEFQSYIDDGWVSTNNCEGRCCIYPPGSKSYKRVTLSEAIQLVKQGYTYNKGTQTARMIEEALKHENKK